MSITETFPAFSTTPALHVASLRQPTRCSVSKPPEEPPPTAPANIPGSVNRPAKKELPPRPPTPPAPNLLEVLGERTLDTVDDVYLHYSRYFRAAIPESPTPTGKPRIVILGSGWAAHSFVKVINADQYEVTVVSPRNFYFFTPLLAATAVGTIEFRSVVDPMRRANPQVGFYEAACTGIDLERGEVECIPVQLNATNSAQDHQPGPSATPFRLSYDYLLISVGERAGTFGVPGAAEHAHFLKELGDAVRLRRAIVGAFELAALPGQTEEQRRDQLHFVVTGGGATGCEFAGELSDFLLRDLRAKYGALLPLVRVTLLQSRNALLTAFEARLQARALDNFYLRRVDVRLNARVIKVTENEVHLADGTVLRFGVLVWAAGNAPRALTASIIDAVNAASSAAPPQPPPARKLAVDDWLRVRGASRVFALGDCALLTDGPLPATAQVAGQQGAYLARAFRKIARIRAKRDAKGKEPLTDEALVEMLKPFRFLSLGLMTYIGDEKALVQFGSNGEAPRVALSGFVSYLLWLSTYAVKQVDTRNRVLVLFDWFKTKVFGRDLSQF